MGESVILHGTCPASLIGLHSMEQQGTGQRCRLCGYATLEPAPGSSRYLINEILAKRPQHFNCRHSVKPPLPGSWGDVDRKVEEARAALRKDWEQFRDRMHGAILRAAYENANARMKERDAVCQHGHWLTVPGRSFEGYRVRECFECGTEQLGTRLCDEQGHDWMGSPKCFRCGFYADTENGFRDEEFPPGGQPAGGGGEYTWDTPPQQDETPRADAPKCPGCGQRMVRLVVGVAHVHNKKWGCMHCPLGTQEVEDVEATVVEPETPKELPQHGEQ